MFAAAEQEYEDVRIERSEWEKIKPGTPLGMLPVLNYDGRDIPQSAAINRFLARKLDLYGDNDFEKAQIDAVVDVLQDLWYQIRKYYYAETDELKAKYKKNLKEVEAPKHYGYLEKLLKSNNGGDGFFAGSRMSLADVAVFASVGDMFNDSTKDHYLENKEPKLKALMERMRALPQIDAWLKKRPEEA